MMILYFDISHAVVAALTMLQGGISCRTDVIGKRVRAYIR